ncbi:MAG: hypothetical protein ABSH30_02880 [Acidimicrobiales bacterium]|jgi:hypothetical protein
MSEPQASGEPSSETGDLRAAGDRIESLLDQLASLPDRRAGQWAEELLRCVTDLYGAGIARIIHAATAADRPDGGALLEQLAGDDLVASLLLVHDLHPTSLRVRVESVLADVRSLFTEADVRLVHLDEERSSIRLRMVTPGCSPARASALERRVREAVEAALPDLEQLEMDRLLPATPVHFGRRSETRGGADSGSSSETVQVAGVR